MEYGSFDTQFDVKEKKRKEGYLCRINGKKECGENNPQSRSQYDGGKPSRPSPHTHTCIDVDTHTPKNVRIDYQHTCE